MSLQSISKIPQFTEKKNLFVNTEKKFFFSETTQKNIIKLNKLLTFKLLKDINIYM